MTCLNKKTKSCGVQRVTLHAKNGISYRICLTILLIHVSDCLCNFHADAFVKCMESPRTRVAVQRQRAMSDIIEKVVAMIPNRNDLTEERLATKILQQVRRSTTSARMENEVKTKRVFMQVRFSQINSTSKLAHRKHGFSLTHPHPTKTPLADIFFRPSFEAHEGYCGDRISR